MELGAVTHFAQGWPIEIVEPAQGIGVASVRDAGNWEQVETSPGAYDFSAPVNAFPDILHGAGLAVSLVFARNNPLYDDGKTPVSEAARRAFADYVAATLRRFPQIGRIEIGNEFNAQNFVSGPVKTDGYGKRDEYYTAILRSVHERIAAEFPGVAILGGAAHSIPVAYLRATFENGALAYSDGIAIHPYTSPPEQVGAHVALLRAAMGEEEQPIHATEFGGDFETPEEAPSYLVRMVSALSAAGVASASWYALREQNWFKNMELLSRRGEPTPAGRSFAFVQRELIARGDAVAIGPDPLAHLYLFGPNALVAWGVPRTIAAEGAVAWYDAEGRPIPAPAAIAETEPVIAISETPLVLGETLHLGEPAQIGDSFFQFDVTSRPDGSARFEGPWSYLEIDGLGRSAELQTMEGGERQNEGWRPYIGSPWRRPLSVGEARVNPVVFGDGSDPAKRYAIIERFTAPREVRALVCGDWRVKAGSQDGIELTILLNGEVLYAGTIADRLALGLEPILVRAGDRLDFVTGPNRTSAGGDATERRIRIYDADRLAGPGCPPAP